MNPNHLLMNSLILAPRERFTFCYESTQSVTVESRGNSTALRQCCSHASVTTKQSHCTSCEERKSRHTHQRCHRIIKCGLNILFCHFCSEPCNKSMEELQYFAAVCYYKMFLIFSITKLWRGLTDSNSAKLRWDQWAGVELGVWRDLWTVEQPVGVPRLEGWWRGRGRSQRGLTDE